MASNYSIFCVIDLLGIPSVARISAEGENNNIDHRLRPFDGLVQESNISMFTKKEICTSCTVTEPSHVDMVRFLFGGFTTAAVQDVSHWCYRLDTSD